MNRLKSALRHLPPVFRPLRVLVLHGIANMNADGQRAILTQLRAFEKYSPSCLFKYQFALADLPEDCSKSSFDVIIFDVTFLCYRWAMPRREVRRIEDRFAWVAGSAAVKLAFPQDDFDHAGVLDYWLSLFDVDVVYSPCQNDLDILYPLSNRVREIRHSFTGYIDEDDVDLFARYSIPFRQRTVDVGYRGRLLDCCFGRHGQLKTTFASTVGAAFPASKNVDVSMSPSDALYGELWPQFLGNCKYSVAAFGGSSVLDTFGTVRARVRSYETVNPNAGYDETSAACLMAGDEDWVWKVLSPRFFEIALAGSCPVLPRDDYGLGLVADVHYIAIDKDYGNLDEAVERMADEDLGERTAFAYQSLILQNPDLRYKNWSKKVFRGVRAQAVRRQLVGK